jgi:hypothetical protein
MIGIAFLFSACNKEKYKPESSFVKIYDDQDGNKSYHPLGVKETSDGGYLVLSAVNGWNISVLKVSKKGDFVWQFDLPENYVNAVPTILEQGGKYYLVCMDAVGLFTYVLQIDESTQTVVETKSFSYIYYPTYAYCQDNVILIQSYNRMSSETGIYQLNSTLTDTLKAGSVKVLDMVEDRLVDHITFAGKRLPFFIGVTPDKSRIVMNGFYRYSFSSVFLDQNLNYTGVYNGANYNGGFHSILPLTSSSFSLARYSYDNLYLNPDVVLDPTTVDIAENVQADGFSDLDPSKPVIIRHLKVRGKTNTIFAASTKANQLVLIYFNKAKNLSSKKYIGQNTPYTLCDFVQTSDGGAIMAVQVKVMGSYNRIALIKLSEDELADASE